MWRAAVLQQCVRPRSSATTVAVDTKIAEQTAIVTGAGMSWSASYMLEADSSDVEVSVLLGFADVAGNAG